MNPTFLDLLQVYHPLLTHVLRASRSIADARKVTKAVKPWPTIVLVSLFHSDGFGDLHCTWWSKN